MPRFVVAYNVRRGWEVTLPQSLSALVAAAASAVAAELALNISPSSSPPLSTARLLAEGRSAAATAAAVTGPTAVVMPKCGCGLGKQLGPALCHQLAKRVRW